MFPSPCDSHHASMVWHLHIYFRKISVPNGPLLSNVWFCGSHWPSHRAQQHLQWCDMASRGRPPPSSSLRVPASPRFENQPPGLSPHLDVSLGGYWIVYPIDSEDSRRQCPDGLAGNHVLKQKEGERLALLIFVWRAWE